MYLSLILNMYSVIHVYIDICVILIYVFIVTYVLSHNVKCISFCRSGSEKVPPHDSAQFLSIDNFLMKY